MYNRIKKIINREVHKAKQSCLTYENNCLIEFN